MSGTWLLQYAKIPQNATSSFFPISAIGPVLGSFGFPSPVVLCRDENTHDKTRRDKTPNILLQITNKK
jgi:hypothetical protein